MNFFVGMVVACAFLINTGNYPEYLYKLGKVRGISSNHILFESADNKKMQHIILKQSCKPAELKD